MAIVHTVDDGEHGVEDGLLVEDDNGDEKAKTVA